jgi:hypothetical protein
MSTSAFAVEAITSRMSEVDPAGRFYVDRTRDEG